MITALLTFDPSRTMIGVKTCAFTLIELLIVITIIAVLAGFLISGATMVRTSAKTTVCASGLRQIYLAFSVYANENENTLPPQRTFSGVIWHQFVSPYLEGSDQLGDTAKIITACPATKEDPYYKKDQWKPGYAMQGALNVPYNNDTCNLQWVASWAHVFVLTTIRDQSTRALIMDADDWTSSVHCGSGSVGLGYPPHSRHRKLNGYAMCDGRVAHLPWTTTAGQAAMTDPTKFVLQ